MNFRGDNFHASIVHTYATMKTTQLCALIVLSNVLLCSGSGLQRVTLKKNDFDLQRVLQQRQAAQDRYLSGTLNGGEDVKLLDFMDAQVRSQNLSYY
jgi:hypothetical protein